MYQFFSKLSDSIINQRYKDIYGQLNNLNKKFSRALNDYPAFQIIFTDTFKGEDMLTLSFPQLVKIYYKYKEIINDFPLNEKKEINTRFSSIYNYNSHRSKIREFISNPDNKFEIFNCVYCDLKQVKGYEFPKGKYNREFHADHVLDKGTCPLVGLSIHNFVPSCPVCNEAPLKGTNELGKTKEDTLILSPKSKFNKFNDKVKFKIRPDSSPVRDLDYINGKGWEIYCDYNDVDSIYDQTINMFRLEARYNAEKKYFCETFRQLKTHPKPVIEEMAKKFHKSYDEFFEDLFGFKRNIRNPMEKCRRELFEVIYEDKIE